MPILNPLENNTLSLCCRALANHKGANFIALLGASNLSARRWSGRSGFYAQGLCGVGQKEEISSGKKSDNIAISVT